MPYVTDSPKGKIWVSVEGAITGMSAAHLICSDAKDPDTSAP
jgi:hypothetical protein